MKGTKSELLLALSWAVPDRGAWFNVLKTIAILVSFWFVFIILLPIAVSIAEVQLAFQRFPGTSITGPIALGLFTLLGLWAGVTLAFAGRGTPLSIDETKHLVVIGPYAYLRHPLVLSALGQGAAVGASLGSIPVLLYFTLGGFAWYFLMRKREEQHLRERFGKQWDNYARAVRGFRPRLRPYRPE